MPLGYRRSQKKFQRYRPINDSGGTILSIQGDIQGEIPQNRFLAINIPECDIPVPGIPGTGNFSFFWWYRNRYRKKMVKGIGIGIV